ncbi:MAG: HlyD family efflux transporter periplasmic adaptor subunit [Chloroflexi bacterium]|nr:HlyD family efflux transporter periplasmic adaptor subunit [Chloroflexota bacterium]
MKRDGRRFLFALVVMILLFVPACQASNGNGSASNNVWSGFLEGKTVEVSAEVAGRITKIAVQEGDVVKQGQPLVAIDDEFMRLRIDAADANVAAAEAQLALLQAGARSEDIQRAQARVDQARLALIAASQVVTDTEAIRANPQALIVAKTDAEAKVIAATQQLTATVLQAQAADLETRFWEDQNQSLEHGVDIRLPTGAILHFDTPTARLVFARDQWNQAGNRAWLAWSAVESAQANATIATSSLKDISDQLTNPIALDNRVNQARAARDKAAANLQAAQAALTVLQEGASQAQIQTAKAALDQARAARATLDKESARYQITAPSTGIVTRVAYRAGEIVAPGLSIVRLSIDGDLKLRVFVSFGQIEKIRVGDPATIFVGESNDRKLSGTVTHIADRAEFTGRQAQTDSERNAQLVAVEIALKDADAQIKAGMPANVVFGTVSPNVEFKLPTLIDQTQSLTFSGSLETKQTRVSAELGGRVTHVRVNRGATVKAGDLIVELDDATIKSSMTEANATVTTAQSNLDQVNEKARPGTMALAESGVTQAEADRQAANAALDHANRAIKSPQEMLTQLHVWEGKVAAAQGDLEKAKATLAGIKNQLQIAQNDQSNSGKLRYAILQKQQQAAEAGLVAAQATLDGNQRVVALYKQMIDNPLELIAAQHGAANQVKTAEAGIAVAQADLVIAKRGPQKEAVALAEAKLRAAQANLRIAQAQVNRFTITSPIAGQIIDRNIEPGETVRAGMPLITIADARELEMTVYVPIRNVGAIKPGQMIYGLYVPSIPTADFVAKVSFISPEAEFKPANIYNSKERSEMVFAVRVTVQNGDNLLKAGLPADVTFPAQ